MEADAIVIPSGNDGVTEVTFTLSQNLAERIERLAEQHDRSLAHELRVAVRNHLADQAERLAAYSEEGEQG